MIIFTAVNDAIHWVNGQLADSIATDSETHEVAVARIGRQIWDEGHVDGKRSGDDWSDWLEQISISDIVDFADEKTDQITPDVNVPPSE